jgi:hypothetical protein
LARLLDPIRQDRPPFPTKGNPLARAGKQPEAPSVVSATFGANCRFYRQIALKAGLHAGPELDPLRRPRAPLRLLATATLVRGVTASFRLASPSTVRLATLRVVERSMRPTDFCFPSLVYEHPYLVGFRPVYSRLAPQTSVRRTRWFTTPKIRFGGPCDCLFSLQSPSGRSLPRDDSQDRASDTPVASFDSAPNGPLGPLLLGTFEGRQDRLSTIPVKGLQRPRSGVPSIVR